MRWILQNNIYNEEGFDALISNLERLGLPYSVHKVIPFVGELDPDPVIQPGERVIVMGSYSLARQAQKRGWKPGAFLDNLNFETHLAHWGDDMLNADAKIYPFGEIPEQREPFFIRPVHDSKAIHGQVMDYIHYLGMVEGMRERPELIGGPDDDHMESGVLKLTTPVVVSRKKEIYSETRFWVVNGMLVTWSGYKRGTLKVYEPPEKVDKHLINFAGKKVSRGSMGRKGPCFPNEAFVLDVADTPDGPKIVEVNNLNSSGFYKCDVQQLLMALENLDSRYGI